MIACYDLARCPPTYDVVAFLAHAELERVRRGEKYIDLYVMPGPVGGFRQDNLWPPTIEERVQLREHVLVPLCALLPSVRRMHVLSDRGPLPLDAFGVGKYIISLPAIVSALGEGCRPLRAALAMAKGDYITFTLREAKHHPLRNSRVAEWVAAARTLERDGLVVIIVRDTLRVDDQITGARVCYGAAKSLQERAQLYAGAVLNVGICNGPMWMAVFMDAPVLMLRPTTNAARGCYDDGFYARHGVARGAQLPTSPPHQRLVWEDDTRECIVAAVKAMLVPA